MIRKNPIPNARVHARALSALAAAVGLMWIPAVPARADHAEAAFAHHLGRVAASHFLLAGELFFGAPVPVVVPVPVAPVIVHREVVYRAPVVYPVVYEQPYAVRHAHYAGCGHGDWDHRGRGRGHGHGKHRGHDRWEGHRGRH